MHQWIHLNIEELVLGSKSKLDGTQVVLLPSQLCHTLCQCGIYPGSLYFFSLTKIKCRWFDQTKFDLWMVSSD